MRIGSIKDFVTGLIFLAFAVSFLVVGAHYNAGSDTRLGPGYFPRMLSIVLLLISVAIIVRSFVSKGEEISAIAWKPVLHVIGSTAVFAALLPRLGLVVALAILVVGCATASRNFKLELKASLGLIILIAICTLVFVDGLGLPIPVWGKWLSFI